MQHGETHRKSGAGKKIAADQTHRQTVSQSVGRSVGESAFGELASVSEVKIFEPISERLVSFE